MAVNPVQQRAFSRRDFLAAAASTAGAVALGCGESAQRIVDPVLQRGAGPLDLSKVQHVIVCMMENRSYDHFLGWVPQSDGRQQGLSYPDRNGVLQPTWALAPDYQGCGHPDPDHSMAGGRSELNGGACDGWLVTGNNDRYAIGYYVKEDLPFFAKAAQGWTCCDRYFSSMLGPTYPNRMFQHCAQTDRVSNTLAISSLPTIWDSLFNAGLQGRYYYSDVPFLALWGTKYFSGPQAISHPISQFYADCAAGTLPQLAMVEPEFLGTALGLGSDDHPYADVRAGQAFLNRIYDAVRTSPAWPGIVLIINYDEWGGFFEHVPPPTGTTEALERSLGYTDGLLGFRVPAVVISPFALERAVAHDVLEHTSILKLVEQRWNLAPLTQRDATATSLASLLFDTGKAKRPPGYAVPAVSGALCPTPGTGGLHWSGLLTLARSLGWPV